MKFNFKKSKLFSKKIIIIGSFLIVIIALSLYLYLQPPIEIKKEDLRMSAILASHQFIKEKLRAPDKAIFQSTDSAEYYTLKEWYTTYHFVVSHFYAETESGTMIRKHYTMELEKTKTVWLMINLDIR